LLAVPTAVGILDGEVRTDGRIYRIVAERGIIWAESCELAIHGVAESVSELENDGSIAEDGGATNISWEVVS